MNPITKVLFNIAGSIFVGIGVLGIFLPLLPTTPFLLLASACYVRGSTRLHRWLMSNRYLGKYITNIQQKRGIPLRGKIISIALLWASLLFSIYRVDKTVIDILLALTGIGVSLLILKFKTLKEDL